LERLEEGDVADYVAAEFPGAASPAGLGASIHHHSGGNPLFMVAILQDLVKRGQLVQDQAGWALTVPLEDLSPAVPDTLQEMLDVQFGQLDPIEQRVLERASVAGDRFPVFTIVTADLVSEHIENVCEGLAERHQFIRPVGLLELSDGSSSAHYEFRHSLYRHAVYQRLSDVHRSRLHRMVGERLATLCTPENPEVAGEVASHFEEGRDYGHAIRYLMLSANNAVRRFAYRESMQTLERALALTSKMRPNARIALEIQVRERIGDAHYWFGAMAESADACEAAATLAGTAGLTAARVHALSGLVRPFGLLDPDRGIAAIEEAEQLSATLGDRSLHAHVRLLAAASRLLYDTWRDDDWATCATSKETIDRLSNGGLSEYHRVIYGHLLVLQGQYAEALRHLDTGIPSLKEPASLMAYFFSLSGKTLALIHSGQFGPLMRIIRAGTEMAEKNGYPWLLGFREAWLRTIVLDFEGATQLCETLVRTTRPHALGQPRTIARFADASAALANGQYDVASTQFEEILNTQLTPKFFLHWYWRMNARLGLSNVWLAAGEFERARTEADRFLEAALSTAEPNLLTLAWEAQARIAMARHEWARAWEHIRKSLAIVDAFQIPTVAWRVHATCADLNRHQKDADAAEAHRARAEAVIVALADSFEIDEPLRQSFLSAAEVQRIRPSVDVNSDPPRGSKPTARLRPPRRKPFA
jgi:tetratricopeptide (TPR) repeat protein